MRPSTGAAAVTSELSGDGKVTNKDALLAYYVLTFRGFLAPDGSDDLTAAILGVFSNATPMQYESRLNQIFELFPETPE